MITEDPQSASLVDEIVSRLKDQVHPIGPRTRTHTATAYHRPPHGELSAEVVARHIDHTLLKPGADAAAIAALCDEAATHHFWSVCINPCWVAQASEWLAATDVKVCTVVGFPLGATLPEVKAAETRAAVRDGATEVDMVINVGALKSRDWRRVFEDISAVVRASGSALVKVILETALLDDEEKIAACTLSALAGADYVKTSTGFGPGGATVEDIRLMRKVVGPHVGVKASGGVRDFATAAAMIEAGASRLGCSSSIAIVTGAEAVDGDY